MGSFYVRHESAVELAASAEIVAVATLTEIVPDVYELPPDPEASVPTTLVYDGLVFTIDKLVKGNDRTPVTVRTPSLLLDAEGEKISRIEPEHLPLGAGDLGKRYLIFLTPSLVDEEIYDFETPDGITAVDGSVVTSRKPQDKKDPLADIVGRPTSELTELLRLDR